MAVHLRAGAAEMNDEQKSILQSIEDLARTTEAPRAFVDQVRSLFRSKGIPLTDDAEPYRAALVEAFRREQAIRHSTLRAKADLSRLRERQERLKTGSRLQWSRIKNLKGSFQAHARDGEQLGLRGTDRFGRRKRDRDGARAVLTRGDRDDVPMVPGPKDVQ